MKKSWIKRIFWYWTQSWLEAWVALAIMWVLLGAMGYLLSGTSGLARFRSLDRYVLHKAGNQVIYLGTEGETHYGVTAKGHYLCRFDDPSEVELVTSPDMDLMVQKFQAIRRWSDPWTLAIVSVQACLVSMMVAGVLWTWRMRQRVPIKVYVIPVVLLLMMEWGLPVFFGIGHPLFGRTGISSFLGMWPGAFLGGDMITSNGPKMSMHGDGLEMDVIGIVASLFFWVGVPALLATTIKRPKPEECEGGAKP